MKWHTAQPTGFKKSKGLEHLTDFTACFAHIGSWSVVKTLIKPSIKNVPE